MNRYYIDISENSQFHAGTKARSDIDEILEDQGWIGIYVRPAGGSPLVSRVLNKILRQFHLTGIHRAWQIDRQMREMPECSAVLLQYPFYPARDNKVVMRTIHRICDLRNSSLIALVHDLDSIREQSGADVIQRECQLLGLTDEIIVHNAVMADRLRELDASLEGKLHILELFDYRTNCDKSAGTSQFERKVTIAGNLTQEKAGYVYQLAQLPLEHTDIDLYGVNYTGAVGDHIRYQGVFSPEDIPFHSGFGLVWDGDSIDTCSGKTGEYTRINNPHKLSLYMAAGIPVIVWREAAIARFVEKHHVGLCVDSLREIDELLGAMTEETYNEMAGNVAIISERVRSGYYTCQVLQDNLKD